MLRSLWSFICFNISDVFGGGSKVASKPDLHFPCNLELSLCPKFLYLLFLVSGSSRSFNRAVLSEVYWDSCIFFTCVQGGPKLFEELLRACKKCPGKSSLCLLVSSFFYEEGLNDISSLLSDRISFASAFPHFLLWEENQIEVIEKMVSTVLRVFYYQLNFSRSEFAKCCTQ